MGFGFGKKRGISAVDTGKVRPVDRNGKRTRVGRKVKAIDRPIRAVGRRVRAIDKPVKNIFDPLS